MPKITVELVAVDHMLWSGEAESLVAETTEGEIGILPGHEPLLGQLVDNGIVVIRPAEGEPKVAAVQGGFLDDSSNENGLPRTGTREDRDMFAERLQWRRYGFTARGSNADGQHVDGALRPGSR